MRRSDREARREEAKALARIAYRFARSEDVCGVIEVDGEPKHVREFAERGLTVELLIPFRAAPHANEFSRLQVRHHGRKVLELRWSAGSDAAVSCFEEGDWERVLRSEPPPIPLD